MSAPFLIFKTLRGEFILKDNLLDLDLLLKIEPDSSKYYSEKDSIDLSGEYTYCREVEAILLEHLASELNDIHKKEYSNRYWSIVIGPWLRTFVEVLYDRYCKLKKIISNEIVSVTVVGLPTEFSLSSPTSNEALWRYNCNHWNAAFTVKLLGIIDDNVEINFARSDESINMSSKAIHSTKSFKRSMVLALSKLYYGIGNKLVKENDGFFINTYLSLWDELILQLKFRQIPIIRRSLPISRNWELNELMRSRLFNSAKKVMSNEIVLYASRIIPDVIPTCFIEGYKSIEKDVMRLSWPRNPKFIFTSNSYSTDEIFKIYTASKTEEGVPYFIGQHGNNFGTHRYLSPTMEEITSDYFITWGWLGNLSQHYVGFNLKISNNKVRRSEVSHGKILFIQTWVGHNTGIINRKAQYIYYLSQQLEFIERLEDSVKKKLVVRLHHDSIFLNIDEFWQSKYSKLEIDKGYRNIQSIIKKSKLVVHSYDSTGLLECMSANVPTIAFWQYGLSHLRDEVQPDYLLLFEAGIIFFDPFSAAEAVNKISKDPLLWWEDQGRQIAIKKFVAKYSKRSLNPGKDLFLLINKKLKIANN